MTAPRQQLGRAVRRSGSRCPCPVTGPEAGGTARTGAWAAVAGGGTAPRGPGWRSHTRRAAATAARIGDGSNDVVIPLRRLSGPPVPRLRRDGRRSRSARRRPRTATGRSRRRHPAPLTPTRGPVRTGAGSTGAAGGSTRAAGARGRRGTARCARGRGRASSRAGPGRGPGHARARRASRRGDLVPVDDLAGPQQHRGRLPLGAGDDVGAEVHAVGEVDVEPAGRAEHHLVAR